MNPKISASMIEPLEPRIAPATLTVNNLADTGDGSLRTALADAAEGDVITFASSLHGILNLASTLEVTAGVTIKASAPGAITLSGQNTVQILSIDDGDDETMSTVKLVNLGFINGTATDAGGAILDMESLTASQCSFFGNHATAGDGGAIAVLGDGATVKLTSSKFSGNGASGIGGAVVFTATSGTLIATDTVFKHNTATDGGALAVDGVPTVQIVGGNIANNTATQHGGGVYLAGVARASFTTTLVADNGVTGTGSTTGGGGIALSDGANLKLLGTTLTGNMAGGSGGGLLVDASSKAALTTSTVSGNVAQWGGGIDFAGDLKLTGGKVSGNTATKNGGGLYGEAGQQNFSMVGGAITGNQALGSTGGGLDLLNGGYQIIQGARIAGNAAAGSGGGFAAANGNLNVSGTTFAQNGATIGGGVYLFAGTGTLTAHFAACTFAGNSAVANGGGLYLAGTAASIKTCLLTGNNATSAGGALYVDAAADAIVNGSTIFHNQADRGGGVYFTGQLNIGTSTLSQNTAGSGGAIYGGVGTQDFLIANSIISGNKSVTEDGTGGGFCLTGSGKQNIYHCNIVGNKAAGSGGGLAASDGVLNVIASLIASNKATFGGGAALSMGSVNVSANFTDSTVIGNKADTVGGGIYSSTSSAQILVGTKVTGNLAPASADLFGNFLQS